MRKRLVQALIATAVAIGAAIGVAGAAGAIDLGGSSTSRGAVTDGQQWD